MPFEFRDFQDLVRLLREHPEWREELRALLLTQELLTLPAVLRELAGTVARLAERMDQLTETVGHLAEEQGQLAVEQRRLAEEQGRMAAGLQRLVEEQGQLAAEQRRMAAGQERLAESQQRIDMQMGQMWGWYLEGRYRTHAAAYFGRFLRQGQPVHMGRLVESLRERLVEEELAEVLLADLILTGRLPSPAGSRQIWVVLEVSATIDRRDVERAQRHAALLRQARYPAVAVAGGAEATAGARHAASEIGVALLFDGRIDGWQEALDQALLDGGVEPRSP